MPLTYELINHEDASLYVADKDIHSATSPVFLRITTHLDIQDDLVLNVAITGYSSRCIRSEGPRHTWFCSPLVRLAGCLARLELPVGLRFQSHTTGGHQIEAFDVIFRNVSKDNEYLLLSLCNGDKESLWGKILRADLVRDLVATTAKYLSLNRHRPELGLAVVHRCERVLEDLRRSRFVVLTPEEELRYDALREWRRSIPCVGKKRWYDGEALWLYGMRRNEVLRALVRLHPKCIDDLRLVKGMSNHDVDLYGDEIMRILSGGVRDNGQTVYGRVEAFINRAAYQQYLDNCDAEMHAVKL